MIAGDGMSIRIDTDHDIFLQGIADPSPVHIEPARMRIQFDHHPVGCTGVYQRLMIHGISCTAQQQTAGRMAQNACVWILDGRAVNGSSLFLPLIFKLE